MGCYCNTLFLTVCSDQLGVYRIWSIDCSLLPTCQAYDHVVGYRCVCVCVRIGWGGEGGYAMSFSRMLHNFRAEITLTAMATSYKICYNIGIWVCLRLGIMHHAFGVEHTHTPNHWRMVALHKLKPASSFFFFFFFFLFFFFFSSIVTAPQVERKRWLECRW